MNIIRKVFNQTQNVFLLILILILFAVALSFIPIPGNYHIYSVMSGSMEPRIKTGSVVFVKPLQQYRKDDVVTVKTLDPKVTITHQIVEEKKVKGQTAFVTRGIANNVSDLELRYEKDIIGKVFFMIPWLGYPISYSKTTQGLILLIIIPSTIIIYSELLTIKREAVKLIARRKN